MRVRKEHDRLRNGIYRHYAWQEFCLMYPSPFALIRGKLHPYRVYSVLWYDTYVAHYHLMVLHHREGIYVHFVDHFLWLLNK